MNNLKRSALLLTVCLTSLLCVGSLSGCVYQKIDQDDIANAADACKDKGGVYSIAEDFLADTSVTCKNGKSIDIDLWTIADIDGDQ